MAASCDDGTPRRGEAGIALLAVLWLLILLSLLAAGMVAAARTETRLARNLVENTRAELAAEAGIEFAVAALGEQRPEHRWQGDGSPHRLVVAESEVVVSARDEAGKVDLNYGAPDLLAAVLIGLGGLQPAEAAAIIEAKAAFHRLPRPGAGDDEDDGDRMFANLDHLLTLPGISAALLRQIAPVLTVHSRQRGIDPAVAPPALRAVLPAMPAARAPIGPAGGTARRVFTIRAEARTPGGGLAVREAVVGLTGRPDMPFAIHAWRKVGSAEPPP